MRSIVMVMYVCMHVCVSISLLEYPRNHATQLHLLSVHVACRRGSNGIIILPVLWMTSCFLTYWAYGTSYVFLSGGRLAEQPKLLHRFQLNLAQLHIVDCTAGPKSDIYDCRV